MADKESMAGLKLEEIDIYPFDAGRKITGYDLGEFWRRFLPNEEGNQEGGTEECRSGRRARKSNENKPRVKAVTEKTRRTTNTRTNF